MTPATDPFMAGHEPPTRRPGDFYRNKQGTPYVSDPSGRLVKPKRKADPPRIATTPYSRPSGFGKIIEDMYSIHKWDQRQEAYGFAVEPTLVGRAQRLIEIEDRESQEWKDEADKIVKAAKLVAKSSLAADRGGHAHSLAEDDDEGRDILTRIAAGEELGLPPDVQRELVAAWREMLERDGLEILAVEMAVVNDTYRAAGTLDRVARLTKSLRFRLCTGEIIILPSGMVVILDIKSGKRRLSSNGTVMYWHGYAVQVFLYGPTACPYDTETDTRGEWPWEVDGKWALIAHLDVLGALDGKATCDLILVDLEAGRRAADLCVAAKAWGREDTVFSVAQLDVEGEGDTAAPISGTVPICTGHTSPSAPLADAPDLTASVTTGEAACGKPATSPVSSPDPDRLALVDARASLAMEPAQGADLTDAEFAPLWDQVRSEYQALDAAARSWAAELSSKATRQGLSFHTVNVRTERSYYIVRALVSLCQAGCDRDEVLRALLALVVGDVAVFPGVHAGHVLGSLHAIEAERLALLVDAFSADRLIADVDNDGVYRLRERAA